MTTAVASDVPGASEAPPRPLGGRELLALALSVALVPLNSTMLAVSLPSIARDLGIAPGPLTQGLVTSYLVAGIVAQSPAGKLGDALGHARALAIGQALFAAGSVAGWSARGLPLLVAARVLMAVGGALMVPSAMALVRVRVAEELRGKAFGAFGAVMGLAAAIGPLVGGQLDARLGWSSLFLANAPLVLLAALLARGAASPTRGRPVRIDVAGALLLGASLTLLVLASRHEPLAAPSLRLASAGLGAALLAAFVAWERRAAEPVVDLTLFARPAFAASVGVIALQNLATYALLFLLPAVLARAFGASSRATGEILLPLTLGMVALSLAGGRLVPRAGARALVATGSLLACAGALTLALWPIRSPGDAALALALVGAGVGLATPAAQAAGMGAVDRARSGMAAGVSSTMRYLGGVAGVAIVGALAGGEPLASLRTGALWFAAALALAAALAAGVPGRRART